MMRSDHVINVTSSDAAVGLNFIIDCSLNEIMLIESSIIIIIIIELFIS